MAKTVSKSRLNSRILAYLREVEVTGEPLVITNRGEPVLRIVVYTPEQALPALAPGFTIRYDDPMEPVGLEDWEASP